MSSPLDGRIRAIAREEAAALLEGASTTGPAASPAEVDELRKEVAGLRAMVERLESAAKTAALTEQVGQPAARRTRKTSSE